jgi:putative pyruvate formate lyase activating enzyme
VPSVLVGVVKLRPRESYDNPHLPRYGEILSGSRWPQFIHTRAWDLDWDPDEPTTVLEHIHYMAVKEMRASGVFDEPRKKGSDPPKPVMGNLMELKVLLATRLAAQCQLCERGCGADREAGEAGECGVLEARVTSNFLHRGEERELVPSHTIFFSGCNLECQFCQNHDISRHPESGKRLTPEECGELIVLEEHSSRNVNWVGGDPTPNVPFILRTLGALETKRPRPQVFNSNMFMTPSTLALLDGVVDVYLTDFKYGNDVCAYRLSKVEGYFGAVSRNHGLAAKQAELLVRHLVMPGHVDCCSIPVMNWLREEIGPVRMNVMDQYRPVYKAHEHRDIDRALTSGEFQKAYAHAETIGHLGLD